MRKGADPPHNLRGFDTEFGLRSHTEPGRLESGSTGTEVKVRHR